MPARMRGMARVGFDEMTSNPRTKGATVPLDRGELDRLTTQTTAAPAATPPTARPNANVVPARRSTSAHLPLVPPTESDEDEVVVTVVMSDDDDDDSIARAPRSRSETLANPLTMSQLVESERGQKPIAPTPGDSANRNIKRRG